MDEPISPWAIAMLADPYSPEIASSRLIDLLKGKAVGNAEGLDKSDNPATVLDSFVRHMDWSFKPEAFDAIWYAVFKAADQFWCKMDIRDATWFWGEEFLQEEALDTISDDEDPNYGLVDGLDKQWIAASVGAARLFALGYGYSPFAWNSFLDGLGLNGATSDSMLIGSCGQLLGGGQRLKLRIHGGGDRYATRGLAGRYLQAQPPKTELEKKEGEDCWNKVLKALKDQQKQAGPKAVALLQKTLEHVQANAPDMTSIEVANIIWPK